MQEGLIDRLGWWLLGVVVVAISFWVPVNQAKPGGCLC